MSHLEMQMHEFQDLTQTIYHFLNGLGAVNTGRLSPALISLRHSVNGDFCGHSRFVLWHENLTTFVS